MRVVGRDGHRDARRVHALHQRLGPSLNHQEAEGEQALSPPVTHSLNHREAAGELDAHIGSIRHHQPTAWPQDADREVRHEHEEREERRDYADSEAQARHC